MNKKPTARKSTRPDPLRALPATPLSTPKFRSEAEEAAWWQAHRAEADAHFARAFEAGHARRFQRGAKVPTRQTTIRLLARDIARARILAERKGLRYQTYIKMLVHEGLEREEAASRNAR